MPRPTKEQLRRINKFAHSQLDEDQVYVFRSLSADTLPVARYGWFGEYSINMSPTMLNSLKKSYRQGVGLLASHNNNRLPFGRTFDAEVTVDHVNGDSVETMYVDHYIVTHTKDDEGNTAPLRTEINGMTTQDIVNHIDVGHTFDTSIGFAISKPTCSICKHDIRDYQKCKHIPGGKYEVQVEDRTEEVRCDIIAEDGEGLENSLVYAGAVDRAIITHSQTSDETFSNSLQGSVKEGESTLYNVDDIKTVPLHSLILCRMSRGNMELFTATSERKNNNYSKGSEQMPTENNTAEQLHEGIAILQAQDVVSLEEYNKVSGEKESLSIRYSELEEKFNDLEEKLNVSEGKVEELSAKAQLAETFTEDLVQDTVKAAVQARGNQFNKERYEKYARSLSVNELKEELSAFREEFSGSIEDARVTSVELQEGRSDETVDLSVTEKRDLAAKNAMARFKNEGGNLEVLTREELAKLS